MSLLVQGSKYGDVRAAARQGSPPVSQCKAAAPRGRGPNIIVRNRKPVKVNSREWLFRELREGGQLHRYLAREKALTEREIRRTARYAHGMRANPKSDFELLASIPARLYHRWRAVDPDFWLDDANLKSLKRDNPDLPVYIR